MELWSAILTINHYLLTIDSSGHPLVLRSAFLTTIVLLTEVVDEVRFTPHPLSSKGSATEDYFAESV